MMEWLDMTYTKDTSATVGPLLLAAGVVTVSAAGVVTVGGEPVGAVTEADDRAKTAGRYDDLSPDYS